MAKELTLKFNPKFIEAAVNEHPGMARIRESLEENYNLGSGEAKAAATDLLTRISARFGSKYLDAMATKISDLFKLRDDAANVINQVIGEEQMSPEDAGTRLKTIFKGIHDDMDAIKDPATYAKQRNLKADLDISEDVDRAFEEYEPTKEKIKKSRTKIGVHVERVDLLTESFNKLTSGKPEIQKIAQSHPRELWRAVSSETQEGQNRLIGELKTQAKAAGMSDQEAADLEQAVRKMAAERAEAQRLPEGTESRLRKQGLKHLRPEIIDLIEGNRYLELIAKENPDQLEILFDQYLRKEGLASTDGFRSYVRHEMVHFYAGMHGEFTAAFMLGEMFGGARGDDFVLVKTPNLNPREPGTDIVGVTKQGRIWMIDNKAYSQSLVDKVSALMGNFPENVAKDASDFNKVFGSGRDPVIGDSVSRLQKAGNEMSKVVGNMTAKEIAAPEIQSQIDAICAKYRIDRVITNAGGEVTGLASAIEDAGVILKDLGITRKPK